MTEQPSRDLVVLVADKDMEQATRQLLQRPASFGISAPTYEVYTHPARDPGCRTASQELLRPLASQFRFALVLFDREGSGGEALERDALERQVEGQLEANGWRGRCSALVLDPELEIWVWTDSSELDQVIGWAGRQPPVREWLRAQGFTLNAAGKPARPKEALREALRHVRKQPSASLFAALAARAGLSRCTDPAFLKFRATLQRWFPP
jgi:hypothetical protein